MNFKAIASPYALTAQAAKDLLHLADVLRDVPRENFNMGCFAAKEDCGTVACALGWAGLEPRFRARGLKTDVERDTVEYTPRHGATIAGSFASARAFFGLSETEADALFMPEDGHRTPKQVAHNIAGFVAHKQKHAVLAP